VASVAGLEFRQVGRTYVVAVPADLRQALKPFAASAFFPMEGRSVENSVKLLEGVLPYLTVRAAGDRLLVAGAEDDIAQARALLAASDRPREAKATESIVLPTKSETRIYAIKYSSAPVLRAFLASESPGIRVVTGPETYAPTPPNFHPITGASLGGVQGSSGANGGGNVGGASSGSTATPEGFDSGQSAKDKEGDRAKTLVLHGTAEELDTALKLLEQLDAPPQQVMVEVKVVDTSLQFAAELGLKYSFAPIAIGSAPSGSQLDPTTGARTPGGDRSVQFNDFQPPRARFKRAPERSSHPHGHKAAG